MTPPKHPPKEKKFFWVEGVTRQEVQQALADKRPNRFRQQGPRRVLVGACATVLVLLASTVWWSWAKLASYAEIVLLALSIWGYFKLRAAVRSVADAPDELLDERQISLRNAAYLAAYRWLAVIAFVTMSLFLGFIGDWVPALAETARSARLSGLYMSFLMTIGLLPSMVLAWQQPSEIPDGGVSSPDHRPTRS